MTPILMMGAGRSGTTFLMRILASHPEIVADEAYPLEFRPFLLSVFPEDAISQDSSLHRLSDNRPPTTDEAVDLYRSLASRAGKSPRYFAEKMPGLVVDRILERSPNARIICVFRDPRDCHMSALEFARRTGSKFGELQGATDADVAFIFALTFYRLLSVMDMYPASSSRIYYEHLMDERAAKTLADLFKWLGIASDTATVKAALNRARTADSGTHRTSLSDRESVGRWRYEMRPALMRAYRSEMGEMLTEMGYPLRASF